MNLRRLLITSIIMLALFAQANAPTLACTGITLKPKDGSIIHARTLEFAVDLESSIIVIPRGKAYTGTAPGNKSGLKWATKYACAGTTAYKYEVIVDGVNEKGLSAGLFYFPGYAGYQKITAADHAQAISPIELGVYLLTTCTTVDEAVAAAKKIKVGDVVLKEFGFTPPVHYILNDAAGGCVVLEYIDGDLRVYKNTLGVMSNSPAFDWHVTNLRNYINLGVTGLPPINLDGKTFAPFGQGTGMLGLPGDFTPPSRFVRAVAFSQSALPVDTAEDGIKQAFHILNQFDIPKGAAREKNGSEETADYTLWTSAADLKNHRFYFRTHASSRIRMVDLAKCNLTAKDVQFISMSGEEEFEELPSNAK